MKDIKQSLAKAIDSFLLFALKKDESSAVKYKNLVILICVVIAIFVASIVAFASCSHKTMIKHPADVNSEEVSFDDNNAVAVDPFNENDLNAQSKLIKTQNLNTNEADLVPQETNSEEINIEPLAVNEQLNDSSVSDATLDIEEQTVQNESSKTVFLFCNQYKSAKQAQEIKAHIAFNLGLMSSIVKQNGAYTLQLGPYESREQALSIFEKLDNNDLVEECSLEIKD